MIALALTKIVNWWKVGIGVCIALVPILAYAFGRREGTSQAKVREATKTAKDEKSKNQFKDRMTEARNAAESNRPSDADALAKRLRKSGL